MSKIKTIGITTGGGDCPGLNAVIRAVVKSAISKYGWRVIGIPDGFDGLIWPERVRELTFKDVSGILERGGTILGTTNRGNPFRYRQVVDGNVLTRDLSDEVIRNAEQLGIDATVIIGGDGTQSIALELFRKGMKVVGVPKTIDNDLSATDITFGFDTALRTATEAIDKLFTTAESHHRVMIVEVMGREAGWIALEAGLAGGAHVILIPEIPFSLDPICHYIQERDRRGHRFTLIVTAEGIQLPESLQRRSSPSGVPVSRAGAVSNLLGEAIGQCSGKEVRVTVLGHIQRGGSPSPLDRILSTRFGVAAVDLVAREEFGKMVCLRGSMVDCVPIAEAVGKQKLVDPEGQLVHAARAIGVCFGDSASFGAVAGSE